MSGMPTPVVQADAPRKSPARQPITLPLDRINPVIRIAHRRRGPLNIAERVIFDHEFVLILAGEGTLTRRDGAVRFAAGELMFIEPFTPHAFASRGDLEHIAVHFDYAADTPGDADKPQERTAYEVRLPQGLRLPQSRSLDADEVTKRRLCEIAELRERGDELAELETKAKLVQVIVSSLRSDEPAGSDNASIDAVNRARLQRSLEWLGANLHRDISAADLADAAGLSPSHFNRLFVEWTGYAPMLYVRRRRVEEARRLLGDVSVPIKEIARRLGFRDPFHFSKVFRQIDGLSPSAYREAITAELGGERN